MQKTMLIFFNYINLHAKKNKKTHLSLSKESDEKLKIIVKKSGLKLIEYKPGNEFKPNWGDFIKIHYVVYISDKKKIEKVDSTYDRKEPFVFKHGSYQIIRGMDNAIHNMTIGNRKRIIIPDNMGYLSLNLGPFFPLTFKRKEISKKKKSFSKSGCFVLMDIELIEIKKTENRELF